MGEEGGKFHPFSWEGEKKPVGRFPVTGGGFKRTPRQPGEGTWTINQIEAREVEERVS